MDKFKSINILLAEDNPGDARLAIEVMREGKFTNKLHHVSNGEEASDFLLKQKKYKNAPTPDLIMLDLNMPKKDGRELLAEIKRDKFLRKIPVVILTISNDQEDIIKSYHQHANCYYIKPFDLDIFIEVIKSIKKFWIDIVQLPAKF